MAAPINSTALDRFTAAHAAFGVGLGLFRVPWWAAGLTAVGWEIAERPLKELYPGAFPHASQDVFQNSAMDGFATFLGWVIGDALRGAK